MIADLIPTQNKTNEERGIPADSWYALFFKDDSWLTEFDTNWSELSEQKVVGYFGRKKQVRTCKYPVKSISVFHGELKTTIELQEGDEIYQEMRSRVSFMPTGQKDESLAGRSVGVVRNGEVVEERFLNGRQEEIVGMRV